MRPQLLHLSGPLRGKTVTYETGSVAVGSAEDAEVQLVHPAVAAHHARIEYLAEDCAFHLRALDGPVLVNRSEVREIQLQDGDLLEFGIDGPRARFSAYYPAGSVCKPVRRMLADAREVGLHSGRVVAVKGFTRDLFTVATLKLKIGFPLFVLALALPIGWLAGWWGGRTAAAVRRAHEVAISEVDRLRKELEAHTIELQRMHAADAVLHDVQTKWSRGICLIHGIASIRGPDGKFVQGEAGPEPLEYTGTGFLISADGMVATNRHVVAPWEVSDAMPQMEARGFRPALMHFTATFPGRPPIDVPVDSIRLRGDAIDVAVFTLPKAAIEGVPVLPLHDGPLDDLPDQRAIVAGYPTGLRALLAKAPPERVREMQAAQADMTAVIRMLAEHEEVQPTITQGVIGNALPDKIVYDAPTTHGGSGGPVFGSDGKVIAVNHAILHDFVGANYGVPVKFVQELMTGK